MKYITMHLGYRFRPLSARFLLILAVLLALSACGQKGPLTLPQPPEAVAEEPADEPENSVIVVPQSNPHGPF
ncbi:LPS translocon maturation chaperone LptM [Alkalimonas amylolytica]|uniref:Lipoprotein-attachment site-containing protein n=1 Tax=Alkalimonas amylolytica TaxID=152573 RepID=A0A1H4EIG4_ALKAM|nr:lipoprotein [Alkalimonas amylolytica]SEA84022.1 lipoprotein-attachment site-containing protein [Alkalimonas amylolytica]